MKLPLILIGPMYTGKSTIASIIAKKLSVPEIPLDYISGYYYTKNGIDFEKLSEVLKSINFKDYVDYLRPFELKAAFEVTRDRKSVV